VIEVMANVHFLCTHEGGRQSFILSGYRPHIRFGKGLYADGAIMFSADEKLFPGDTCNVKITFPKPELVKEYLKVGTTFDIHEGPHKIGEGEIVSFL
jgi:translation elongation factor EF-Tu-like GTPase